MTNAVKVDHLVKTFKLGEHEVTAIQDISFEIKQGEFVAITGASGSGKSTLLHIMGTLDCPTKGSVQINGQSPFEMTDKKISEFRCKNIGFIFQENNLMPEFDAYENIILPGIIDGKKEKDLKNKANRLIKTVGMESRINHLPYQLSGGEMQRIAIARALINEPALILADEPCGSLDSKNSEKIHELFNEINSSFATTIVVVSHNLEYISKAPRILTLSDGVIQSDEKQV
jgi:ABC-type lipoprotein export system ATPase subunit